MLDSAGGQGTRSQDRGGGGEFLGEGSASYKVAYYRVLGDGTKDLWYNIHQKTK